jgi:hypothetical protein
MWRRDNHVRHTFNHASGEAKFVPISPLESAGYLTTQVLTRIESGHEINIGHKYQVSGRTIPET